MLTTTKNTGRVVWKIIRGVAASIILVVLASLGLAAPAGAVPVTWTLQDVTFTDGGTATGSFVYDADTNIFSGLDITTSFYAAFGSAVTYSISTALSNSTRFDAVLAFPLFGNPRFIFDLVSPMTNAGGTINIALGFGDPDLEGICINSDCSAAGSVRFITSGAITSVPEPATIALFGAGLAGLGWIGRRRKAA